MTFLGPFSQLTAVTVLKPRRAISADLRLPRGFAMASEDAEEETALVWFPINQSGLDHVEESEADRQDGTVPQRRKHFLGPREQTMLQEARSRFWSQHLKLNDQLIDLQREYEKKTSKDRGGPKRQSQPAEQRAEKAHEEEVPAGPKSSPKVYFVPVIPCNGENGLLVMPNFDLSILKARSAEFERSDAGSLEQREEGPDVFAPPRVRISPLESHIPEGEDPARASGADSFSAPGCPGSSRDHEVAQSQGNSRDHEFAQGQGSLRDHEFVPSRGRSPPPPPPLPNAPMSKFSVSEVFAMKRGPPVPAASSSHGPRSSVPWGDKVDPLPHSTAVGPAPPARTHTVHLAEAKWSGGPQLPIQTIGFHPELECIGSSFGEGELAPLALGGGDSAPAMPNTGTMLAAPNDAFRS
ncbi:unnamed protein product [Durusdinium trenchii]|uniref:Uncharacterized protein n=1 Tax=Durusdinium trenchii TaxID=1381693 RepID=A0ABP0LP56_9DINO